MHVGGQIEKKKNFKYLNAFYLPDVVLKNLKTTINILKEPSDI